LSVAEYIAPAWRARLAALGLTRAADLLERSPTELGLAGSWVCLTKPGLGRRQRWRWKLPGDEHAELLYLKRYGPPDWKSLWDRAVRQSAQHSRGWWECDQSRALLAARVAAPLAVAAAERMTGVLEHGSVVLFAAAEGDAFDRLWPRAVTEGAPITRGAARHQIATLLARFVAEFHQTGLCHRDLYLCHIFAQLDFSGSAPPEFTLIDLARAFRPRWRRQRWIIKDLAQLDASARQIGASRTDRLRFLNTYLGLAREGRLGDYARRIIRKSDWILSRIARKSRQK
jgi:hypothetical protein